jgi:5'-nucleotidase
MTDAIADISKARILVTNDDGINAPGLKVLENIARALSDDVWVVAPEINQSGAGHSLTLTQPLRFRQVTERHFAVMGTPTDCVLLADQFILKDKHPDVVLSGVNRGANIADDVTYSGTIAAAMEGALLGVTSIALSQHVQQGQPVKWATAEAHGPEVIRRLTRASWPNEIVINVNFPDTSAEEVKGVSVVRQGRWSQSGALIERHDPAGNPYYWLALSERRQQKGDAGTDLGAIREDYITVTPLYLDLTHDATIESLKGAFG